LICLLSVCLPSFSQATAGSPKASPQAIIVLIRGKLFALQAGEKAPTWSFADKLRSVVSFVETDKYVIAGAREGQIIVLDARSGKVLRTTATEGETRPVLAAGDFVVGTISGLFNEIGEPVFAYDLSKWKVVWHGGHANPGTLQIQGGVVYGSDCPGFTLWALDTGRQLDGTLAGTDTKAYALGDLPYYLFQPRKVVIGAGEDNVVELHLLDGARKSDDPVWTYNTGNPVLDVRGDGTRVFVLHGAVRPFSSLEQHAAPLTQISALDADTGKPIWNTALQANPADPSTVPPYLRAERLLPGKGVLLTATVNQYSVDDDLANFARKAWGHDPTHAKFCVICIDAVTGKERWHTPTDGYEGIAAIDQSVVVVRARIDLLSKVKEREASYAPVLPPRLVKVQEQASAMDIVTGKRLWQRPGYSYIACRANGTVLLWNGADAVIDVDPRSGDTIQRHKVML
jgi:outer membrane protein assembly factor BamB